MIRLATRAARLALAAAALLAVMLPALSIAARADAPAVVTRGASLYARPSTSSKCLAGLSKGQALTLRKTSGAWSKVLYQGKTAYIARKSIQKKSAKKLYAAEDVKLRKENDASADAYGQIKSGTVVYALDAQGSWYKALYLGYTGYVPKDALTAKKPTPTPTPTPKPTPTPAPDAAYAKSKARLYKRASTANQIATIPKGAEVLRVYYGSKSWAKVVYAGKTGYVAVKYLSDEPVATATPTLAPTPTPKPTPTPAPSAAYVKAKTRLYKRASTASQKITLPKGAEVLQSFYKSGKWAKVRYKSRTGYVLLKYLSDEPLATSTPEPTPTPSPTPAPTATPSPYQQLSPGDTGNAVKKMQTRLKALGWFNGTIGGNYLTRTTQAVKDFQDAAGLKASGVATSETLERLYASNAPECGHDSSGGESTATPATGKVVAMDWWTSNIQSIFYRGRVVVVTDVRTGLSWREARLGGTNHADCEPMTAKDTAALKAAYGGSWSWNRRPVWVSIGGVRYAASMNGMPHGSGPRNNGFSGHHCIHFTNSRTHATNRVDPAHQAAIQEALAAQ